MFIALRYGKFNICLLLLDKFRMGMSTTGKVELTAVLYLFLCCKPNINDLIHTLLITNLYPTKCYHYENAV